MATFEVRVLVKPRWILRTGLVGQIVVYLGVKIVLPVTWFFRIEVPPKF